MIVSIPPGSSRPCTAAWPASTPSTAPRTASSTSTTPHRRSTDDSAGLNSLSLYTWTFCSLIWINILHWIWRNSSNRVERKHIEYRKVNAIHIGRLCHITISVYFCCRPVDSCNIKLCCWMHNITLDKIMLMKYWSLSTIERLVEIINGFWQPS